MPAGKASARASRSPPATSRRARAQETRSRIVAAAQALFLERGYGDATMEAIAKQARVAVQTVYFTFHTKGALFVEVIARMAHGDRIGTPVAERPWQAEIREASDPQRSLAILVEHGIDIFAGVAPLWPFVSAAAQDDPDFAARIQAIIEQRRAGLRSIVTMLGARGLLRMPLDEAADTFFLTMNPELLALSGTSLGWSLERYKAWAWRRAVGLLRDQTPRPEATAGLTFAAAAAEP